MSQTLFNSTPKWKNTVYCTEDSQLSFGLYITMFGQMQIFEKYNLDDVIQRLVESGILNFWRSKMLSTRNTDYEFEDTPLSIAHISSSFLIIFGGGIMSLSIFVIECVVYVQCHSDKLSDQQKRKWIFFSKIIDDQRYFYVTDYIK